MNTIESGQAFFLQNNSTTSDGTITIKEIDKATGSNLVSRNSTQGRVGVTTSTLEINLHSMNANQTSLVVDGVKIDFDGTYSNAIDNYDVRKIINTADNLAVKLGNKNLIVERRNTLTPTDTIFLALNNTRVASYRFEIDPSVLGNLPLNAFLKDKFLQTETAVSLTAATNVNFDITNDAASRVADRFMIVFKQAIPIGQLTGNFISIAIDKNADKTNKIKWTYTNELNIAQYSVELSKNGAGFIGIGNQNAENTSSTKSYLFNDAQRGSGSYSYRIKATSTTGQIQYSDVVKIIEGDNKPAFAVRPNPVENKTLRIIFENMEGDYLLRLVSKQGATVFNSQTTISSSKEVKNIVVDSNFATGVYELILTNNAGKSFVQTIFIQ